MKRALAAPEFVIGPLTVFNWIVNTATRPVCVHLFFVVINALSCLTNPLTAPNKPRNFKPGTLNGRKDLNWSPTRHVH
ncbi:hypothetical protein TNCV_102741 [Trichonephila clavipes]|nr:hypothetical protein TNCV_102741 [Trichonephila clavipes]